MDFEVPANKNLYRNELQNQGCSHSNNRGCTQPSEYYCHQKIDNFYLKDCIDFFLPEFLYQKPACRGNINNNSNKS